MPQLLQHQPGGAFAELAAALCAALCEAQRAALKEVARADVGGHNDDRVLEAGPAPLRILEAAVLQNLQQQVEHVGVSLFHLVEQHHRVGPAADQVGELAALLKADIAGRGADHPRHRVLFHIFGHIQPDHAVLRAEQLLGQRLAQLGFADAGGAEKEEGGVGAAGIV